MQTILGRMGLEQGIQRPRSIRAQVAAVLADLTVDGPGYEMPYIPATGQDQQDWFSQIHNVRIYAYQLAAYHRLAEPDVPYYVRWVEGPVHPSPRPSDGATLHACLWLVSTTPRAGNQAAARREAQRRQEARECAVPLAIQVLGITEAEADAMGQEELLLRATKKAQELRQAQATQHASAEQQRLAEHRAKILASQGKSSSAQQV